jgi:hypothetical protein
MLEKEGGMHMKEVKAWYCEVDLYRNGAIFRSAKEKLYDRQTEGNYVVGAKTAKEAREILQKAIGFGSITVPKYKKTQEWIRGLYPDIKYKESSKNIPKQK